MTPFPSMPDDIRRRLEEKGIDIEKAYEAMQEEVSIKIPPQLSEDISRAPYVDDVHNPPSRPWGRATGTSALSQKEVGVLQLISQGANNKEVAEAMYMAPETVKTHMKSILRKLDAANRAHACCKALRQGIIE